MNIDPNNFDPKKEGKGCNDSCHSNWKNESLTGWKRRGKTRDNKYKATGW